jgi:hypothetical protein
MKRTNEDERSQRMAKARRSLRALRENRGRLLAVGALLLLLALGLARFSLVAGVVAIAVPGAVWVGLVVALWTAAPPELALMILRGVQRAPMPAVLVLIALPAGAIPGAWLWHSGSATAQLACDAQQSQVQARLEQGDIRGARNALAYVVDRCGPSKQAYVDTLDLDLKGKEEAARAESAAREAAASAEKMRLADDARRSPPTTRRSPTEVTRFVAWALEHRENAAKATSTPKCRPDGWCSGLCKDFVSPGAFCGVQYWETEPHAVRFDIGTGTGPLICADLGEGAVERARTAQDIGCTLSSGMLVLINLRGGTYNSVFVVTPEYLAHDSDMRIP